MQAENETSSRINVKRLPSIYSIRMEMENSPIFSLRMGLGTNGISTETGLGTDRDFNTTHLIHEERVGHR